MSAEDEAFEEFRELLRKQNSIEPEWQALFAKYPFILSRSLPLRLNRRQIKPLGRPGMSEPDFVIMPDGIPGSPRGIIELKTPHSKVLTFPRKDLVILSRAAETAVRQTRFYANHFEWPDRVVVLGDEAHLFVIMGMSVDWADKLMKDFVRQQMVGLLGGVRVFGYDQIFTNFESAMPRRVILLTPDLDLMQPDEALIERARRVKEKLEVADHPDDIRSASAELLVMSRPIGLRLLSEFGNEDHGERWHVAFTTILESEPVSGTEFECLLPFAGSSHDRFIENFTLFHVMGSGVISRLADPQAIQAASTMIERSFEGTESSLGLVIDATKMLLDRGVAMGRADVLRLCAPAIRLVKSFDFVPASVEGSLRDLRGMITSLEQQEQQ